MDNQQSTTPSVTASPQPPPPPPPPASPAATQGGPTPQGQSSAKRNVTPWIVLSIFVIASLLTGLAYFFLPAFLTKEKTPTVTDTQTTNLQGEVATWTTYENTKYGYSFFYPVTWEIRNADTDQKKFELHYTGGPNVGMITVKYLTPEELKDREPFYCETEGISNRCQHYPLTANSRISIDRGSPGTEAKTEALIYRVEEGGTISIKITAPNTVSDGAFFTLITTISFPNEEHLNKLQVCPDSWTSTEGTVTYNGVQIPIKDIDAEWIRDNCQSSQ